MGNEMNYVDQVFRNISAAEMKRRQVYTPQYHEGFEFRTNCNKNEVERTTNEFEAQGLEVFVGNDAWFGRDVVQSAAPGTKTILVRKKKEI
jgi:hypothetical protein